MYPTFLRPPILTTGDYKRMLMRYLAPQDWYQEGLGLCSYTDEHGHAHNHVISSTHESSVISHHEIQLVDVNTIMTHNFTTKIMDHNDPTITPRPVYENTELHRNDATLMSLKSGCPQSREAMDYLSKTISRGSTAHAILKAFLPFLEKANQHQSAPTRPT